MSRVTASLGQSDTQDVTCHPQLYIPMAKDSICSPASAVLVAKLSWPRMEDLPGAGGVPGSTRHPPAVDVSWLSLFPSEVPAGRL